MALVVFGSPLAYLVLRGASEAPAVAATWWSAETLGPLARSLALAGAVAAATAVLGTTAAWLVARTDVPWRRAWAVLLPLPLVIPSFIGAFALLAAFAPGGLAARTLGAVGVTWRGAGRGPLAAFAVLVLLSYPYVYLPVVARLRGLSASLEETARLLGHGPLPTFARVVWPQARAVVAGGSLLVFLYVLSDFGAVQLLGVDTLTRAIYSARIYDPTSSLALSLLLGVLAVAVAAGERVAVRHTPPPGRARPALRVALGAWRAPAVALLGAIVAFALVGPLATLGWWAARGLLRGSTRAGALVADLGALGQPALATVLLATAAGTAAVAVVLPVAWATVRRRGRLATAADAVVVGAFALPGLVIALAAVFWTLGAPISVARLLYQSPLLLVAAYVVHFGAQALRASQAAVAALPPQLEDAARTLGAGRLRRLVAVELPLLAPGLGAGGGLVALSVAKELPATLLLAPPGTATLATTIWQSTEDAFLADASLAALVLVALSAALTWVLLLRGAVREGR